MSPDKQLIDLLAVLVERFGAGRSLGEVYATVYALSVFREGLTPSLAEVCKVTGCSKQNLSRWLQYQVDDGHAKTYANEDDARVQDFEITKPEYANRHLQEIARILGCEVDQPRR